MLFIPAPKTAGLFFFASWLTMVFWGIIAPDLGIPTIGYPRAMLVTIALWLVVAPAILAIRQGRDGEGGPAKWGWRWRRRFWE